VEPGGERLVEPEGFRGLDGGLGRGAAEGEGRIVVHEGPEVGFGFKEKWEVGCEAEGGAGVIDIGFAVPLGVVEGVREGRGRGARREGWAEVVVADKAGVAC
jgi:hypothetical protein